MPPIINHCDGAFFATEAISNPSRRWRRCARHDRQRWRDGVAAVAMEGNNQEMASCPLSSVIAMERSSRQKQSPTRLGDGVAALAMAGNSQEIAAPASHKSYFLKRSGNITRVVKKI